MPQASCLRSFTNKWGNDIIRRDVGNCAVLSVASDLSLSLRGMVHGQNIEGFDTNIIEGRGTFCMDGFDTVGAEKAFMDDNGSSIDRIIGDLKDRLGDKSIRVSRHVSGQICPN